MRGLSTDMLAEIAKAQLRPVVFVYAEFNTGPIYLWSGLGSVSWNGQTWLGVGTLGNVSSMQETNDVSAVNLVLSLSGIPSDLLSDVLTEVRQGKQVIVWLGALDETNAVIIDPYQAFAGRMDLAVVDEGADTSSVSITVESVLVDMHRLRAVWFTDQAQQERFPGDKGFEFVPQLQEKNLTWGIPGSSVSNTTSGGGGSDSGRPPVNQK